IGCGDYLRRQVDTIISSQRIEIKSLYDIDDEKAGRYARMFDAEAAASSEAIFSDREIAVLLLFTPPWARKEYFLRAVEHSKHVIMPKPLAVDLDEATTMIQVVQDRIHCAVFYRRTGNALYETLKQIFSSGEIGRLSLYCEQWLHHFPQWNTWATDPAKNRGPFMDAMIHTLNIARYLMDGEVTSFCFFSDNHAQQLRCKDTEFLKVNFSGGGAAHLFITWAADLEVYDPNVNEREFILNYQMITDQGWYVRELRKEDGSHIIEARKENSTKTWPLLILRVTAYDEFVETIERGGTQRFGLKDAWKDVKILTEAYRKPTNCQAIDLSESP
ncbi:MAG: Gfo/Idh/MocA family oxidoreductase, partial [Spirochaetaceae bacterium]